MGLRDLLRGRRRPPAFEWVEGDPDHDLVRRHLDGDPAAEAEALGADRERQARIVVVAVRRLGAGDAGVAVEELTLKDLAKALMKHRLPFEEQQLVEALEPIAGALSRGDWASSFPLQPLVTACERMGGDGPPPPAVAAALEAVAAAIDRKPRTPPDEAKMARRIRSGALPEPEPVRLDAGEPWAAQAVRDIAAGEAWGRLLAHAATLNQAKPSQKWRKEAGHLIAAAGRQEVRDTLPRWFALVGEDASGLIAEPNASVLRGLAWYAVVLDDESLAAPLGELADACFRKIPDLGARSTKAGNAALAALAELPGTAGAAQLGRMRSRLKLPSAQERVAAAMGTAAERAGVSPDELEELAVPTFGLAPDSTLTRTLGEHEAILSIAGTDRVELAWRRGERTQKTVPEAVKRDHADALAALKATRKELKALLPAQRGRLERLFSRPHGWPVATWRERYLDQPVVGAFARRLVWRVGDEPAIWWEGRLVDRRDREVARGGDARVTLWHPIDSDVATVQGWRLWLEEHLVAQPFKQAHREVYLLTDAERGTGTYSNRFAGHVLRQHQLASLLRERGWRYTLQGTWDSENTPTLALPAHELTAELWLPMIEQEETETGVYTHVSTDQVRFRNPAGEPAPLADVPPVVFSEVMRDADLFVGVCSVGNDPTWQDSGDDPAAGYGEYWNAYAFGELSAAAAVRRDLLERLVPKLAIADRARIEGRFLVVEGQLNTYKIHLGSANVQMEPGTRYLCVVRDATPAKRGAFLPFEGDAMLSLIISKAFLLADDRRITDPAIVSQL